MIRATNIANLFLAWASRDGDIITNLKLQKLLYYTQAWYMVNFNKRFFSDSIEAWDSGPIVRDEYFKWKKYQSAPIPYRPTGNEKNNFGNQQIDFLTEFYCVFSHLSATALTSMVHNEDPWKETYALGQNKVIDTKVMRKYYLARYKEDKIKNKLWGQE